MTKVSKIDLVITWVDGSDPQWQEEKNKYSKEIKNKESNNSARYRDWDNLKYVFRSIEKNMPWINNIFLVTCGQVPSWLNINNPKVKLVFHEQFIPKEYLPTFSSHVIELNLHRIEGLSENFIYFNDDIFAINPLEEKDFFINGLPCDSGILNIHCPKKSLMIHTIANNDTGIINEHFDIKSNLKRKKYWFNFKYGAKNILQNIILSNCPRFPGFKQFHMSNSFLKSTFEEIWSDEYDTLNSVCLHKFRNVLDVNQWVVREWQLVSNRFVPTKKYKIGQMIDFEKMEVNKSLALCKKTLFSKKYKLICINDGDTIENFEVLSKKVNLLLEKKFPNRSSFEKNN